MILISTLLFSLYQSDVLAKENKEFRVVGYYSEIFDEPVDKLQFDKITHIIYSFLIPKDDGALVDIAKPEKLKELVKQCHENNVKVFIAVGGWSYENIPLDETFEKMAASDEARNKFVENIMIFIKEYDLDGVDLDWEYPDQESSQNYERLILELKQALIKEDKCLTAALCGAWSETEGPYVSKAVTSKCLEAFDWINIMAYDMNNADHSPYWFAETSIDYWANRGMDKEKLVIGVPFYAKPSWKQYRDLVKENPEYAYQDYVKSDEIESYYNGIPTIKEKTRLALNKAFGIMIFDINEDVQNEFSLVKAIHDTINQYHKLNNEGNILFFDLNNQPLTFEEDDGLGKPYVDENNRTLIPVRKCLETIGANVEYEEESRTVIAIAEKDGTKLEIPIGQAFIKINGKKLDIDTKAIIKKSRTYAPLRYIFEAFGYQIEWHNGSRSIKINK